MSEGETANKMGGIYSQGSYCQRTGCTVKNGLRWVPINGVPKTCCSEEHGDDMRREAGLKPWFNQEPIQSS